MYSLVYNRLKVRIVVFCHLTMSLFTSREGEAHLPKSLPCLKKKKINTLVLERAFLYVKWPLLNETRGVQLVAIFNLNPIVPIFSYY